jgi:hypothetical protein
MTDEEFRAIIAAGPAVVMVESRHMIALLDERDALRAALQHAEAAMEGMESGQLTAVETANLWNATMESIREALKVKP